ncbi:uncharacterized protein LAESUDRAFT_683967, partial [Laetiporus sulphureus 93-53]
MAPTPAGTAPVIDTRFVVGGIYIITFIRTTSVEGGFHWGLYHHTSPSSGTKYHVTNMGPGWLADHGTTTGVMRSHLLVGLKRIGYCSPSSSKEVADIVQSVPLNQVPPGRDVLDCRTWAMHIVGILIARGYVKCSDIQALENEVQIWSEKHHADSHNNRQPRVIEDSTVC